MEFSALRTKVARRILGLFILCALVPIGALSIVMYRQMARLVAAQARERLEVASKGAGLDLFRRFHDVDAQLRVASPEIIAWQPGREPPPIFSEMLARLAVRRTGGAAPLFVLGTSDALPPLPPRADSHLASGRPVLVPAGDRLWLVRNAEPVGARAQLWAELAPGYVWDSAGTGGTLTTGMSLCVLHRDGGRLHCPREAGTGEPPPEVTATRVGGFVEFDAPGGQQLGAWWPLFLRYQLLADDLIAFVSQPRTVALAAMSDFRWTFVPAVLLALWLVLLLVYVQVRRTTAPLSELRIATQRVSALDFTKPVVIRSGDEFEDVAHSFNDMATRLDHQFAERDRLTAAVQRTSEALRESEQRLRAILETAPDGVVTADANGIIEEFNRTAEKLFGYVREEVIGKPVSVLLAEGGPERATFYSGERRARRKDESAFPVELGVSEAQIGAKTIYTGFVHDITERRRQEEAQARLEAQLRQTQKLETIGTLAGGIAHDFNNILTGVLGYVDLALAGTPPDAPARQDMKEVRAAAERAKALVRQILTFSRKADSQPQPVELDPLVSEARALLRASIPATIEVRATVAPKTPIVQVDPTQLHQVIMNLGTNAYYAMRDNGSGTLEIHVGPVTLPAADDPALAGVALPPGRYACLSVRDSGHGMDPATLERIFEPFFTTKPVGEGTGLGLSVVHGIVSRAGGAITVDSIVGKGTEFRILLPESEGGEESHEETADWSAMRGSGRILVVDDDATIASMIGRVLDSLGYTVTVAANGRAAVDAVRAAPGRFDLVISDLTMPELTGDQVGTALSALRSDLRLILMTGQADHVTPEQVQTWGFHGQMSKPLGARTVAEAVQRVMRSTPSTSNA